MRRNLIIASLVLAVLFLLTCVGFVVPLDLAIAVVFGWIMYLARVVPDVRIGWAGVATAVVCLVAFAAGLHVFLTWLYSQVRGATATDDAIDRWKPRWTAALVSVVVVMFVAGLATVGVTHQVGWLLTSQDPLTDMGRDAVWRAQSINNLKQVWLGLRDYQEQYKSLPPAGTFDAEGRPLHSWQAMNLPYIGQDAIYNQINFQVPWDEPRNGVPFREKVTIYSNPGIRSERDVVTIYSNPAIRPVRDVAGYAPSHYAGNVHMLGGDVPRRMEDAKDGGSVTVMAGEVNGGFKPWGDPTNWRDPARGINRSPAGFGSPFPGGASFLFVDGSVHFLKDGIDPQVLKALSTPVGGEKVSAEQY